MKKKEVLTNAIVKNLFAKTEDRGQKEVIGINFIQQFDIPRLKEDTDYTLEDFESEFRKQKVDPDKINLFDDFYERGLMTTNYDDAPLTQFEVTFNNFVARFDKEFKYTNRKCSKYYIKLRFNGYPQLERSIGNTYPKCIVRSIIELDKAISDFKENEWQDLLNDAMKITKGRDIAFVTLQNILDSNLKSHGLRYELGPNDDRKHVRVNIYSGETFKKTFKIDLDALPTKVDSIIEKITSIS